MLRKPLLIRPAGLKQNSTAAPPNSPPPRGSACRYCMGRYYSGRLIFTVRHLLNNAFPARVEPPKSLPSEGFFASIRRRDLCRGFPVDTAFITTETQHPAAVGDQLHAIALEIEAERFLPRTVRHFYQQTPLTERRQRAMAALRTYAHHELIPFDIERGF